MPGPTGETNNLRLHRKNPILCLGPDELAAKQKELIEDLGGSALELVDYTPEELLERADYSALIWWGSDEVAKELSNVLSAKEGPIIRMIMGIPRTTDIFYERHLCVDTTASGGNAELLSALS